MWSCVGVLGVDERISGDCGKLNKYAYKKTIIHYGDCKKNKQQSTFLTDEFSLPRQCPCLLEYKYAYVLNRRDRLRLLSSC